VLHDESGRPVPVRNPLAAYKWLASSPPPVPAPPPDSLRRAAAWMAGLFVGPVAYDAILRRPDTRNVQSASMP